MLSIQSISAGDTEGLARYFDALAGVEDYYGNEQELEGYWAGDAAGKLGLIGALSDGQLIKALQGFDPIMESPIAQNAGNEHKPGWDCTFSAPKAVSALWATADESLRNAIEAAHRQAVNRAIQFLEQEAVFTRHGKEGLIKVPAAESGGVVCAVFQHSTSREQDPQLHSHCLLMNFTFDGRGLDLDTRWQAAAGACYRAELAQGLMALGFSIERDDQPEREDWPRFFKISGLPDGLVDEWSKRRQQVREAKLEWLTDGATAAKFSRKDKGEISRETLFRQWSAQALAYDLDHDGVQRLRQAQPQGPELTGIDGVLDRLTRNEATFTRAALVAALLEDAQGVTDTQHAIERAQEFLTHEDVIAIDERSFTSRQMLALEAAMVDRAASLVDQAHVVVHGQRKVSLALQVEQIGLAKGLSAHQMEALRHITGETRLSVIQGHAGTGKSYLMGSARQAWQHAGLDVRGVALSNAAAKNLTQEAGIQSSSIHAFLSGLEGGRVRLSERTVLVVDEAGMVGTRQMGRLMEAVDAAGGKLVLVGDSQQLQPVEAGGAMAGIVRRTGCFELTEVRRQSAEVDRRIAADLRLGRADRALETLQKLHRLHLAGDGKSAQREAVQAYLQDRAAGRSVLLLAATGPEVNSLNTGVQAHLQRSGDVAAEGVLVRLSRGYREFAVGDRLLFKEACNLPRLDLNGPGYRVINGTLGTVLDARQIADNTAVLDVKLDGGEVVRVDTAQHNKIDLGYAITVHKAQGTTVDRAHVLMSAEITQGKQWSYVAGSRHRQEFHVYTTEHLAAGRKAHAAELAQSDLAHAMSRSRLKDLAMDRAAAEVTRLEQAIERDHGRHDR